MKKYLLIIIVSLIFVPTALPAQPSAPADTEAGQAITRLREGLVDSFNHGDIDRLLTYLDTNAVVTWQNGEVCEGPAAVKAYYERMMKGDHPVVSKVTADPKILGRQVQGDWAVSWGSLNDRFVLTDGRELPLDSRFTATIVRRGDRWLVSAFHVSVNAFENPVMALVIKKVSLLVGLGGLVIGLLVGVVVTRCLRRPKSGAA
ncbi:MAG: nuclear transport factor 2 family protein [Pedosphaera sp.]|nr:nuclear transport factor 2 family protein [Pedosphaera sp.]